MSENEKKTAMKKHKMLIEIIAKEESENGGIDIKRSIDLIGGIGKVAKKFDFDCYCKAYPKDKLDYNPTGKEYNIKTLEDIIQLDEKQFEFFVDDLRSWVTIMKQLEVAKKLFGEDSIKVEEPGMLWQDTGLTEAKMQFNTSNKV